jgi:hypothetical protein
MKTAVEAAGDVYRVFLDEVVDGQVLNDRKPIPLSSAAKVKMEKGLMVHPNPVRLLTISGKGGVPRDGDEEGKYIQFFNVTLLDHNLSTVRGSLVAYALKSLEGDPSMDSGILRSKLHTIAAIAFLHDLDKDQGLPRNTPLTEEIVKDAMCRYGIDAFLSKVGIQFEPEQMRYLIENVEGTQSYRHLPKKPIPRAFEPLPLVVRSMDQLDGVWCLDDPEKGGLAGVVDRLHNNNILPGTWKPIKLFDPHHPFLLDELQRHLSIASLRIAHLPPLIEVHRDGELFMLLPEQQCDKIVERAVEKLCAGLPFDLEVKVSNRGVPSLLNGAPTNDQLARFIAEDLDERCFLDLFKINSTLISPTFDGSIEKHLDILLAPMELEPRWPKSSTSALTRIYSSLQDIEGVNREFLQQAAHLILLLNVKMDAPIKSGIPSYGMRENELLRLLPEIRPEWISGVQLKEPDPSRRVLTSLWVLALSRGNPKLYEAVWGREGLLKHWLEGGHRQRGFRDFISRRGSEIGKDLERRLIQLLSGRRVAPESESELGRCLFTDEPVEFNQTIKDADGLYGIRVSAFSGRDGRPELLTSERAHTNVSASSYAEHKTRTGVHKQQGGVDEGVPILVSSPTTSGLFGGLTLADDKAMASMSIYDLNRLDVKKGRIISESSIYRLRHRIARLERMPEKLSAQLDKLRMFLKACRRVGRPIHIFRGLPISQRAFFHYDAMPMGIVELLGGNSLRLEQISEALKRIETAQVLIEANGLGYEAFRRYANPKTRFGAICLAWGELRKQKSPPREVVSGLAEEYLKQSEENSMSELDGALVKFGQAAATIQERPAPGASANEELLVFKIAMDTVAVARRIQQTDERSLIYAVAGELETNLYRRDKTWLTQPEALRRRCLTVAEIFVRDVWLGALQSRQPGQADRRVLASIYRMAFVLANRKS